MRYYVEFGFSRDIKHMKDTNDLREAIRYAMKMRKNGYFAFIWDNNPNGEIAQIFDGEYFCARYFVQEGYGPCDLPAPIRFDR